MKAARIVLGLMGLWLLAEHAVLGYERTEAKPSPHANAVTSSQKPAPKPEEQPIFIPVVHGRLLLYKDRRRIYDRYYEVTLPFGGYWRYSSYRLLPEMFGGFVLYTGGAEETLDRTRIVVGFGEDGARYYYYYEPAPWLYVPYYMPLDMIYRELVSINSPTVRTETAPPAAAPSVPAPQPAQPSGGFGSKLAPMLGGPVKVGLAFALGEAMLRDGRFAEAVVAFKRAVEENPRDPTHKIAASLALMAQGDYTEAYGVLRDALSGLADWSVLRLDGATVFGSAAAYEKVLALLREAAEKDPASSPVQALLGFQYFAAGQYEKAAEQLWRGYEAGCRDLLVLNLLIRAQKHLRAPVEKNRALEGPE